MLRSGSKFEKTRVLIKKILNDRCLNNSNPEVRKKRVANIESYYMARHAGKSEPGPF